MDEAEANNQSAVDALEQVISALRKLGPEDRRRILKTVATFFQVDHRELVGESKIGSPTEVASSAPGPRVPFSDDRVLPPKEFLLQKNPRTDVERIACLAFYLTHYLNTPRFKTLDLSKLNTEAAQPKFSNAAFSANNAVKLGYLAQAPGGEKQLSGAGEEFVRALPDRKGAKAAMSMLRPRRLARKRKVKDSQEDGSNPGSK